MVASAIGGGGGEVSTSGARPVYFSIPLYLVCAKGMEEREKKTSIRSEPPCRLPGRGDLRFSISEMAREVTCDRK